MKYLIFSFIILSIGCSGPCIQGEGNLLDSKRDLEPIHGVNLDFPADLVIAPTTCEGCPPRSRVLELLAQSAISAAITTEIKDGILHISSKGCVSSYTPVTLKLYVDVPMKEITLSSSGTIISEENLTLENALIHLAGSGKIQLKTNSESTISTKISGSGDIVLNGNANELNVDLSGSGNVEALGIQVRKAHIKQSGTGDVNIHVTNELGYALTGTGDLMYRGSPIITENKQKGTGIVNRLSPN